MAFDPERFRKDFPLLTKKSPPVYFDNACMTLRPRQVTEALSEYYNDFPACAGRSVHALSRRVDEEVYKARRGVQRFIGAKSEKECVFLRNATEGINLVARSFPFRKGQVILVSDKEHNSNLLPWQLVAKRKGLRLDVVGSAEDNTFSMENFEAKLEEHQGNVAMVALGTTSNLDGASIPAKEVAKKAHSAGAKVLFDAAQTAPHHPLDVRSLDADFVVFSGHKMLGPSGIGVLYGKEAELLSLELDNVGGETVTDTTFESATWEGLPHRFEAGLQHYAGIIGLGAAVKYLEKAGLKNIERYEQRINALVTQGVQAVPGSSIIGPKEASLRGGITSFNLKGLGPHDVAGILDASSGIMIRSGAHCVHSWFNKHQMQGSARASLYLYNTEQEAERFAQALKDVARVSR